MAWSWSAAAITCTVLAIISIAYVLYAMRRERRSIERTNRSSNALLQGFSDDNSDYEWAQQSKTD